MIYSVILPKRLEIDYVRNKVANLFLLRCRIDFFGYFLFFLIILIGYLNLIKLIAQSLKVLENTYSERLWVRILAQDTRNVS